MPQARRHGVNFALTLTVWDYLFQTAYVPNEQADLPLGFAGVEHYPHTFAAQQLAPFAELARASQPGHSAPTAPGEKLPAGAGPQCRCKGVLRLGVCPVTQGACFDRFPTGPRPR